MPEGDTVFAAAARLRAGLAGRVLESSDFRIPSLATADLSGRGVSAVRSVGRSQACSSTVTASRAVSRPSG